MSKLFLNAIHFRNTSDATSATASDSSVSIAGGLNVAKSAVFGGNLSVQGINANSKEITNVASPTAASSVATRQYVDSKSASSGIGADSVDNFSIELVGTPKKLQLASTGVGTGLVGGSGTALSINPNLVTTSVTTTTLSAATFSLSDTTDSTAIGSGSLITGGGISIGKNVQIGGGVVINGGSSASLLTLNTTGNPWQFIGTSTNMSLKSTVDAKHFLISDFNNATVADFSLNTSGNTLTLNAITLILNTSDSTSGSTGSFRIAGGAAIAKNVTIGGNISGTTASLLVGSSTAASPGLKVDLTGSNLVVYRTGGATFLDNTSGTNLSLGGSSTVSVANTIDATSTTTGSFQVKGGIGISGNMYSANVYSGGLVINATGTGPTVPAQFYSTSLATGSFSTLQIGVAGANYQSARLYFNYVSSGSLSNTLGLGIWNAPQGLTVDGNGIVKIPTTIETTSIATGALQIAGGVVISKTLRIGYQSVSTPQIIIGASNGTDSFQVNCSGISNFSLINTNSAGYTNILSGSSAAVILNTSFSVSGAGVISSLNTTDATSIATGSLQIAGGVGISKTLYVGGSIFLTTSAGNAYQIGNQIAIGYTATPAQWFTNTIVGDVILRNNGGQNIRLGTSSSTSNFDVLSTGVVSVNSTIEATASNAAAFVVSGGVGIAKSVIAGTNAITQHLFKTNLNASDTFGIQNTNVGGYSSAIFYDNTAAGKSAIGWANSGAVNLPSSAFFYSSSNIALDTAASVKLTSSLDSTAIGTGSLISPGGASFGKSISLGGKLTIYSLTAGSVSLTVPSTVATPYTLTLPDALPSANGYALVADTTGKLSFTASSGGGGSSIKTFAKSAGNNVTTATDISGLSISDGQFIIYITAVVTNSTPAASTSTLYILEGTRQPQGTYDVNIDEVGPAVGFIFSVSSSGVVQYTSPNISGWLSTLFTIQILSGASSQDAVSSASSFTLTGGNNVTTPADIAGIVFNGNQFARYIMCTINSSTPSANSRTLYLLEGVKQQDGTWMMTWEANGPEGGIVFSITSAGQLQYTSVNTTGWTGTTFEVFPAGASGNPSQIDPTQVLTIINTTDSTSLSTGSLQLKGGAGITGTVYGNAFKSLGGNGFALSGTATTIMSMSDLEIGILSLFNTTGSSTFASFQLMYTSTLGTPVATLIGGNNITVTFLGSAVQIKSTNAQTYTMKWSYLRLL